MTPPILIDFWAVALSRVEFHPRQSGVRSADKFWENELSSDPIVIVSYARTPMGSFQGALAGASATDRKSVV